MQSTPYLYPSPARCARPHSSFQIEISGIPAENGKCRVETQLKIGFHLRGAITGWKQLRLPRALIAKEKHRMEKFNGRDKHLLDSEILILDTRLVCDHDMTKILECCDNCIGRERKRAHRRKESLKLPGPLSSIPVFGAFSPKHKQASGLSAADESDPPTPTDPVEYQAWERNRIMVFSSTEYVDIAGGECMLPTRITCYCRHHNEKVGFRIQFTARDSNGAIVASVLTNPVMMMDDHKSGKKGLPTPPIPTSTHVMAMTGPSDGRSLQAPTSQTNPSPCHMPMQRQERQQQKQQQQQQDQRYQQYHNRGNLETKDADEDSQEDTDEIDLEACHHIPRHIGVKVEDEDGSGEAEGSSNDILTSLPQHHRMGCKRRVDEGDENDADECTGVNIHTYHQQTFRRKTSHDIAQYSSFHSSFLPSAAPSRSSLSSPSPFMPGSPFASDEDQNAFAPSFAQAMGTAMNEQFLLMDQDRNAGMFPVNNAQLNSSAHHSPKVFMGQDGLHQESSSVMMKSFTTLDESMSSQSEVFRTAFQFMDQVSSASQVFSTRASFSIPTTVCPVTTTTSIASLYSHNSPVTSNHPLFMEGTIPAVPTSYPTSIPSVPGLNNPSFLDASQMQEFHAFHRQNVIQQRQQHDVLQLQHGLQQQKQQQQQQEQQQQKDHLSSLEPKMHVPWIPTPVTECKDPFHHMKVAMSQTTSPSSSAYIPIPMSPSDQVDYEPMVTSLGSMADDNEDEDDGVDNKAFTAVEDTFTTSKKDDKNALGCSCKGVTAVPTSTTTSGASSPIVSPKAPSTNMPSSPSPPPSLTPITPSGVSMAGIGSTSAAAAAQFLLYQQQQQHQLQFQQPHHQQQHLQQQLQQQQKQAILSRLQKPRVQRVIPAKGSVEGGIEVTLLGSGFFPGMVPTFDGVPALNVQFYGPETVICTAPPRVFPGAVVVKAQHQRGSFFSSSSSSSRSSSMAGFEGSSSPSTVEGSNNNSNNELIRTMSQLLGRPSAASLTIPFHSLVHEEDDGALFEYEEDKGDRDLIALALQVLGMKMNGRVELPHQVAMRIMSTAAAQQQQLVNQQNALRIAQQQLQLQQQEQQQQNSLALKATETLATAVTTATTTNRSRTIAATTSMNMRSSSAVAPPASTRSALTPIPLQSPQSQLLFQSQQEEKHQRQHQRNQPRGLQYQ
ncbi:hypothetical protein BGX28_000423 [Mortierella sp. GBA30]|nr:hypothetical protein BGX28_000423 [Mortierella sp. GBA30]